MFLFYLYHTLSINLEHLSLMSGLLGQLSLDLTIVIQAASPSFSQEVAPLLLFELAPIPLAIDLRCSYLAHIVLVLTVL